MGLTIVLGAQWGDEGMQCLIESGFAESSSTWDFETID